MMVTYMTEDFLRKCTKSTNPLFITKLNLSGRKKQQKIKVIENLHLFTSLVHLNLSDNHLQRIGNLKGLKHLKYLNLSNNCISSLDGLGDLFELLTLNLNDNAITDIPPWISKNLPKLKTLLLSSNKIETLHQLIRLRGLTNLTVFAFRGNPAVDQLVLTVSSGESDESNRKLRVPAQHDSYSVYRLYTLFILRTLVLLDDQPVTTTELQLANERFGQVELSNLIRKLRRRENCLMKLQLANTELARGLDSRTQSIKVARAQQSAQEVEISKLEQELCMKDELLQSKTDELARACLKHYELERELAFHKIDSKLASALLGPPPKSEWGSMEKVHSTGEHPYLGRCRSRYLLSNVPSRQSLIPEFSPDEKRDTTSLQQVPIKPEPVGETPFLSRNMDVQTVGLSAIERSSPSSIHSVGTLPVSTHLQNGNIRTNEQRLEATGALDNQTTTKQHTLSTLRDVHHLIHRPCSPISHLESQEAACKEKRKSQSTDLDSHALTNKKTKSIDVTDSKHQSITNGLLTHTPCSLTDSKLYAHIAHLESELALAWNLTQLRNGTSCKRGDGSSLNSEPHSSTYKLGQTHPHSHTGSSRQVPGRIAAAPVADNLLPGTPVPLLSGSQIVDQEEQSTGVNRTSPTSSPVPSNTKPDRALSREHIPVRAERVPSLDIQLDAGQPIKSKLPHQTDLNRFSPSMHHSAASSSTPSSRTTGTGRSGIPMDSFFDKTDCDMKDLRLHQQQSRTTTRHSDSQTQELLAGCKPYHRTSIPSLSDRLREPGVGHIRHTKPFESSSDSLVEASGEELLSVVDAIRQQKSALSASSSTVPRIDSHSQPQSGKTLSRMDSTRRHSELHDSGTKQQYSPNRLTRSFVRRPSGLCHRSDETHSDGGPSSAARQARNSITRTSASGASANGATNGLKRKRKVLRSMSTIVSPRHLRLRRVNRPRGKSTDTLENHAEQLLDLLSMSRKACAFEMDQMRSDLVRIENLIPRATRSLDNASSSCCSDSLSPTENRKNSRVTHKLSLMDTGPQSRSHSRHNATTRDTVSGRGTVRSFADTLTTVTRPSPNGHDDDSFDQLDTVTPKPPRPQRLLNHAVGRHDTQTNQRRARRLLPSTSGPEDEQASFQCEYRNGSCSQDHTPCSNEWTPDQVDDMAYGCDLPSPVRGHGHRSCVTGCTSRTPHMDRNRCQARDCPGVDYKVPSPHWYESERPTTHRPSRRRSLDAQQFRALSLADRQQARGTRHMETGEEDDPSTETAALLNLTEELVGLRQGLKRTRQANSGRLEMALRHISLLEMELQHQRCLTHEAQNARERQAERARWEKRLAATLAELKQCQVNIGQLRAQMDKVDKTRTDKTQSQSQRELEKSELEHTRIALDTQREEISRLNGLLHKLLGINPAEANPSDLTQLQTGLVELNRRVQTDSTGGGHLHNADPLRRAQSMHAGLAASFSDQRNMSRPLTPLTGLTTRAMSGQLFCNVPEHHYLEDCMEQLRQKAEHLEVLQVEQQKKLRQTVKWKKKLEKQLEERDLEIDRLNTDVTTNQDELSKVTAELACLRAEKELVQRQDQQRLVSLASDLATVETAIHKKHEELTALSEKLSEADTELRLRQAQAKEAISQREEARNEHSRVNAELSSLNADITQSKGQTIQLKENLTRLQTEVDELNNMKRKLQLTVNELEDTIRARESELQRLSSNVSQAELKLSRLEADVQAGEQRIQNQNRLLAEDEAAMVERKSDLRRLAQKLEEDKHQLELLARETGEQRTELELLRTEKRRTLDSAAVSTRELALKTENKQRELGSIQSSLDALLEEKTQLTASVEALETERHQLRSEIQANHESAVELKTSIGRQKRELEHLTEMGRLEDNRIRELKSEQRELLGQLEKLRAQVRAEADDLHGQDVTRLQKNSELEASRTEAERAQSDMERMQAQRNAFEVEVTQLRQERDLIRTQLERMQQKVKELEKQETQLLESLSSAKLELARVRSDAELESTGLHQIQHKSISSRNEFEKLSKQLEDNRAEMDRSQRLLLSVKSTAESHEKDLSEKRRQRAQLTGELNILGEAVQVGRIGKKAVDEEREASESALQNTLGQLNQAKSDKRQMEQEIQTLQNRIQTEKQSLEQHLVSGRQNLNAVDIELAQKSSQLDGLRQQIQTSELRLAELGRSKSRFTELQQTSIQQGQQEETPRSRTSARQTEQLDVNSELARTKLELASSQRDCRRIKRRTARELAELERIAEDQCNRAGELAEQLTLVKRQYAQLRGQISTYGLLMDEVITIASQTELSEHSKRLEAALAAVRSELDHNRYVENEAGAVLSEAAGVTSNGCSQRTAPFGNGNQLNPNDEFTGDLHRSLFQLTNSFHNTYQPSCDQQSKSPSNIDASRLSHSPSGLYKPNGINRHPSTLAEVGENTCRTGTTTVTSGLGSSLLNRTANSQDSRHGVSHLNVPTQQDYLNRVETNKAELQRKFSELVAHQREQAASDWDKSGKKFRALRCQVDELRDKLHRDGPYHGRSVKQKR